MALSVLSYTNIGTGWFSSTSPRSTTGLAWSSGDRIVVIAGTENTSVTLGAPTNANLTFPAAHASSTSGTECEIHVFSAVAGSAQTGQAVAMTGTGGHWGHCVLVIAGGANGVANAIANLTESSISRTVAAGSIGIHAVMDFNATNPPGKTPLTGSGTALERLDQGNGTTYAQWVATWVGMSAGTFSFGPNSYTSLQVAQAFIEITDTGAAGTNAAAGHASSTGAASSATTLIKPSGGNASATGAAANATTTIKPSAAVAAATGAAGAATTTIKPSTTQAAATGAAHNATVSVSGATNASAGHAAATGAALAVTAKVSTVVGQAAATGSAHNATVQTGSSTNVNAGHAAATGQAFNASVSIAMSAVAAFATAVAFILTTKVNPTAGHAAATGQVFTPAIGGALTGGTGTGGIVVAGATSTIFAPHGASVTITPAADAAATVSQGTGTGDTT